MKDFAKSYEQAAWQYAANSHARMKKWLTLTNSPDMIKYASETIAKLEQKYPQLKD